MYVGGLSHSVTQKDLKDRFGKFGDVKDVELKTRKDEQGEKSNINFSSVSHYHNNCINH